MSKVRTIYIGFDAREKIAADVCRFSLDQRASAPLRIQMLDHEVLRQTGQYDRPWKIENGQKVDVRDGRPFSTDFSFTRFLMPLLNLYEGWALFCDCDFLFLSDVEHLFKLADPSKAVMVVQHDYTPRESTKMDGVSQVAYPRKNWSSLILWNCGHPSNRKLTRHAVNHQPGSYLHGFQWLADDEIGSLPSSWNWLSGVNALPQGRIPDAVHFTLGGPWFERCTHYPFSDAWENERRLLDQSRNPSSMESAA